MFQMWKSIWSKPSKILSGQRQNLFKCAKRGQFAKVCRSTDVNYLGNNEEQQEETEIESTGTDTDPVAYAEFTTNNGWENYQIDDLKLPEIAIIA